MYLWPARGHYYDVIARDSYQLDLYVIRLRSCEIFAADSGASRLTALFSCQTVHTRRRHKDRQCCDVDVSTVLLLTLRYGLPHRERAMAIRSLAK